MLASSRPVFPVEREISQGIVPGRSLPRLNCAAVRDDAIKFKIEPLPTMGMYIGFTPMATVMTSIRLDTGLADEAVRVLGAKSRTEAVHTALREIVR